MTEDALSAAPDELSELTDLALIHSTRLEVLAAAAWLQEWPLDEVAGTRMQQTLTERVPSAQQALGRLQAQSPLPGVVSSGRLRSVPHTGGTGGHQPVAPRAGAPLSHRAGSLGSAS